MNPFETLLITNLREVVVTQAVLLFFTTPTGTAAVIFGKLVGILFEKIVVPAMLLGERKGLLYFDKATGAIYAKKMDHAQETGNIDDWHDALGGL